MHNHLSSYLGRGSLPKTGQLTQALQSCLSGYVPPKRSGIKSHVSHLWGEVKMEDTFKHKRVAAVADTQGGLGPLRWQ